MADYPYLENDDITAALEYAAMQWDHRLETDVRQGKLDQLAEEAFADYKARRTKETQRVAVSALTRTMSVEVICTHFGHWVYDMDKIENKLEFLTRVADEFEGTLNAASAIQRVRGLIDDVERAAESFRRTPPKDIYGGWRPFALDIVSYYSVGYVTCLEWHVRSRLTDLFTYAPESITDKDLDKNVGAKVLVELIASKASIPQFVAATRNYSSAESYLNTFSRVFEFLNLNPSPRQLVHNLPSPTPLDAISGIDRLTALYEERNMLVHEINRSHVGHPVSHAPWTCEIAVAYGKFVQQLMEEIETIIRTQAPAAFPNKLLADGSFICVDDVLDKEIERLEAKYSARIPAFKATFELSREAREAEEGALFFADIHQPRWVDLKAPARRALRSGRLAYLRALEELFSEQPDELE